MKTAIRDERIKQIKRERKKTYERRIFKKREGRFS